MDTGWAEFCLMGMVFSRALLSMTKKWICIVQQSTIVLCTGTCKQIKEVARFNAKLVSLKVGTRFPLRTLQTFWLNKSGASRDGLTG